MLLLYFYLQYSKSRELDDYYSLQYLDSFYFDLCCGNQDLPIQFPGCIFEVPTLVAVLSVISKFPGLFVRFRCCLAGSLGEMMIHFLFFLVDYYHGFVWCDWVDFALLYLYLIFVYMAFFS